MEKNTLTEKIIAAAYKVQNTLGCGFLEKVYEKAMILELQKNGLNVDSQKEAEVLYKGQSVGKYYIDLLVEEEVIVEIKTAVKLNNTHEAQLLNYLNIAKLETGLLFNFQYPKVQVRRLYR